MKKILPIAAIFMIVCGIIMIGASSWGLAFTYQNVARENITTPDDASIPETPVRGPLTLKAQADIIREHVLKNTEGKTFSEMPRQIPKLDEAGNQVMDEEGKPVMTANTTRDMWVTATALTSALNLGILTYGFCVFVLCVGLLFIFNGFALHCLGKDQ